MPIGCVVHISYISTNYGTPLDEIIFIILQNIKIRAHTNVGINKLYSQMQVMVFTPKIYFLNFVQVVASKVSVSLQPYASKFVSKRSQN